MSTARKYNKEYQALWRERNPDYNSNYAKTYVRKTKQKYNPEAHRAYYEKNKARKYEVAKLWMERNPEKLKAKLLRYRHGRRASGKIDWDRWLEKCISLGWKCQGCFRGASEVRMTIDHITAVSRGGTNDIENLQPLCLSCNASKSNK